MTSSNRPTIGKESQETGHIYSCQHQNLILQLPSSYIHTYFRPCGIQNFNVQMPEMITIKSHLFMCLSNPKPWTQHLLQKSNYTFLTDWHCPYLVTLEGFAVCFIKYIDFSWNLAGKLIFLFLPLIRWQPFILHIGQSHMRTPKRCKQDQMLSA